MSRLTKWKGERGGGRGSLLAGGVGFGRTLGFGFVETVVWVLLLSRGAAEDLDTDDEEAV